MELNGRDYLDYLERLLALLQAQGVSEYDTPALRLKLGAPPPADTSNTAEEKKSPVPGGFLSPSLWPDGKPPTFPKG